MADMTMIVEYEVAAVSAAATNVLNFVDIGGDNDESTCTAIAEEWGGQLDEVLNDSVTIQGLTRFTYPLINPTSEIFALNDAVEGTVGTDLYAVQTAYRVDLFAGLGPRRRGHIYIPGVSEDEVASGGLIDSVQQGGIVTRVSDFITNVATNQGFLLGVYSRVGGTISAVNGVAVSPFVRTQRRRLEPFLNE